MVKLKFLSFWDSALFCMALLAQWINVVARGSQYDMLIYWHLDLWALRHANQI